MTVRLIKLAMSDFGTSAATGINLTDAEVLLKTEAGPDNFTISGITAISDICHDYSGNLYICDYTRNVIVKVAEGGEVRWVAGARNGASGNNSTLNNVPAADARFNGPVGICCDKYGTLYIADSNNHQIRTYKNGFVNVLAGKNGAAGFVDGAGPTARFDTPTDVAVDKAGTVYVADTGNHAVRKIKNDGKVVTLAGNNVGGDGLAEAGTLTAITEVTTTWPSRRAMFNGLDSIAVDAQGNIYVADDQVNHRIKKITPDGQVHLYSGSGAQGTSLGTGANKAFTCSYYRIYGLDNDESGNIYVTDARGAGNSRIIKVDFNGTPSVIAELATGSSYQASNKALCTTPSQAIFVGLTY